MSALSSRSQADKDRAIDTKEQYVSTVDVEAIAGDSEAIWLDEYSVFRRISEKLQSLGVEERGLQRVMPAERTEKSTRSILWLTFLWMSGCLTLSSLSGGLIGPLYYGLSFAETSVIIWFGGGLGAAASAYLATFGKRHGLRALANSRYSMGWWVNMAMSLLNIVTECAFGVIACLQGGQALNVVSKGKLPVAPAIVIIGVVSWFIATGGFKYVTMYQRYAWVLPLIVYIAVCAVGGKEFEKSPPPGTQSTANKGGLALSYLSLQIGGGLGWAAVSADYYVYFPESTSNWTVFFMAFIGILVTPAFGSTVGAGFGAALYSNPDWMDAWNNYGSVSAVVEIVCRPLGDVRYFFIFVLAWTMVANNVFNLYSIGISMQVFGSRWQKVPRYFYTFLASIIITLLAVFSRNSFYNVLSNLGSIIGYWTVMYFVIIVEEDLIFRRKTGYDLSAWNDRAKLPLGYAAGLAFCIGAAGAIVAMGQTWYHGPIAKAIAPDGGDIGTILAFAFSVVSYPLLRYLELQKFKR